MSAYLRCQFQSSEECLLVDVSALVPGCLAQTQRLPHCVLNLELGLDHLGGVQRVGVRRAPVILQKGVDQSTVVYNHESYKAISYLRLAVCGDLCCTV